MKDGVCRGIRDDGGGVVCVGGVRCECGVWGVKVCVGARVCGARGRGNPWSFKSDKSEIRIHGAKGLRRILNTRT